MWGDWDRRDGGVSSGQECLGLGEVRTYFWIGPEPRLAAGGRGVSQGRRPPWVLEGRVGLTGGIQLSWKQGGHPGR